MDPDTPTPQQPTNPGLFRYVLGFLLVGAAWGLTTPFMRKAALSSTASSSAAVPESRRWLQDPNVGWLKRKVGGVAFAVFDTLRRPAYAVPLVINLTGSVWFFLLVGQAGMFWISLLFFICGELCCVGMR